MDSWNIRDFRNHLSIFVKLIKDKGLPGDFDEFNTILEEIDNKELVEYKFDKLVFFIDRLKKTVPENLNYCQIFLEHMLMVKDDLKPDEDPLYGYYFDLNLFVYKSKKARQKEYTSSWHHDRHISSGSESYTHPIYHFQFGGKKFELIDHEMSVLSSPRLPHPPMDIFLGFHFIISNYYDNKIPEVRELLDDYDYQFIIKKAQERLWTPYFNAFDSSGSNTHKDFTLGKVFPLYLN
jgi:hypothetical protein